MNSFSIRMCAAWLLLLLVPAGVLAQQAGGVLRAQLRGDPPSLSIHEEATLSTNFPAMPLFNNLVIYAPNSTVETPRKISPELALRWKWGKDGRSLNFVLRQGVRWHDGKPFTSRDVQYTWQLLRNQGPQLLRKNPRRVWYQQVQRVSTEGKHRVTFHLRQSQPSLLAMLASGYAPVYPAHISPDQMRTRPVGSGPMRLVHWQRGREIKLERNPHYWKSNRPYLDGIVYTVIPNHATRMLALSAGQQDLGFPHDANPRDAQDVLKRSPQLKAVVKPSNASLNLIINPKAVVLQDADIRQAINLMIDRQAFQQVFGGEKSGFLSGVLMSPPYGVWGLAAKDLQDINGYNHSERTRLQSQKQAQQILRSKGYSSANPLPLLISTRDVRIYRNAATLLAGQLSQTFIRPTIRVIERSLWHARIRKGDFQIGMNITGLGPDDPDAMYFENYVCESERNYSGYCNQELEQLFQQQSHTRSFRQRLKLVHQIERRLLKDNARPIILQLQGYTIWSPRVGGLRLRQSAYHGWRMEDVWISSAKP